MTVIPPVSSLLTDTGASSADQTSYSFLARNIGTAALNRYLFSFAYGRGSSGDASALDVRVNGVSGDKVAEQVSANNGMSIWRHLVQAGEQADFEVDWTVARIRCRVAIYRVVGLIDPDPTQVQVQTTMVNGVMTLPAIDCAAEGAILVGAIGGNTAWVFGNIANGNSATTEASRMGWANEDFAAAQTGRVITATQTGQGAGTSPIALAVALR